MSLVDTTENKPELNARVFRRKKGKMVLVWDFLPFIAGKRPRINARSPENNEGVLDVAAFTIDEKAQDGDKDKIDTVICVIDEPKARLDSRLQYIITVWYSGINVSERLKVEPEGVYPEHESEDKSKNLHLYAWDDDDKLWRKVSGVRDADGKFYLGMMPIVQKKDVYQEEKL